jgi:hypothetical protein
LTRNHDRNGQDYGSDIPARDSRSPPHQEQIAEGERDAAHVDRQAHRIVYGKLVEEWSEKDMIGLLQQIGIMPPTSH